MEVNAAEWNAEQLRILAEVWVEKGGDQDRFYFLCLFLLRKGPGPLPHALAFRRGRGLLPLRLRGSFSCKFWIHEFCGSVFEFVLLQFDTICWGWDWTSFALRSLVCQKSVVHQSPNVPVSGAIF